MINFRRGDVEFNYRVAAVILRGDEVLLQRIGDAEWWCLPGGRVDELESGLDALRREVIEEIGLEPVPQRLLWVVENFFVHKGIRYHEASLYFLATLPDGCEPYAAREPWTTAELDGTPLLFQWRPLATLESVNLVPSFLRAGLRDLPEGIEYLVHRDGV